MANGTDSLNNTCQLYTSCLEVNKHMDVIGVYPDNRIENVLNSSGTNTWVQFHVPEIVTLPSQKPDIETLTSVHSCIKIISQRVIKTPVVQPTVTIPGNQIPNAEGISLTGRKLIIEGLLVQKIIYTAAVDEQSVHSAHFTVPFSVYITVRPDTALYQQYRIDAYIEDIFASKVCERSVFENTTIFIKANRVC